MGEKMSSGCIGVRLSASRAPYALWRTTRPAREMNTTPPGICPLAIASFIISSIRASRSEENPASSGPAT
jgi:hypothetical protein